MTFVRYFILFVCDFWCLCATSAVRARLPLFVRDFRCSCATSAVRARLYDVRARLCDVCARLPLFVYDFHFLYATSAVYARLSLFFSDFQMLLPDFAILETFYNL